MSLGEHKPSSMRLVLLGPPGAGKGTQAKILADSLAALHIASGDIFRYHQRKATSLGLKVTEYMSHGLLVPDEITIAMVLERALSSVGENGSVLDGFPRNLAQAQALDEALAARGQKIDQAIHLMVPQEEVVRRLSGRLVCRQCQAPYNGQADSAKQPNECAFCGGELFHRQDDTQQAVVVRIRVYQEQTEPLMEYYAGAGKLVEVDGMGTTEEVEQRLFRSLLH